MSIDVEISLEESDSKGRYVARVEGTSGVAELTFSRASDRLVIVDHTKVPDSLRGMGVGAALAARVVADARENDFKIVPLCPFFRAQAGRHPEWADRLAQ
ncbi:GNAT family N-acetyltransferase [Sulfitobacter sp. D35]|uniref:GNAT family N-acetyltransferase n=1 Tax=Sulfitobacter sp. D35 TaxID=3083252 RepID=UPI00296E5F0E|nr:GNAT family N-acetyltransferase [Sulfitobacter sp. D35]MDW4497877.1 GNAT family N-acetyltransferase [Sulfitobacter sp. D35]